MVVSNSLLVPSPWSIILQILTLPSAAPDATRSAPSLTAIVFIELV